MSKLDKNQRIRTSKPRNVFDLSHDYLFTATTGQLRPVSHDILQPGDKVKGKFNFFLRTMPLSTAAMVDVDFMVDYFFVPMELLWLPFGAWWSQTKSYPFPSEGDGTPSILPPLNSLPYVHLDDIFHFDFRSVADKFASYRLLDDLGLSGAIFGDKNAVVNYDVVQQSSNYPYFFPWQAAAYQCIYQHWYRDEERESFSTLSYAMTDGEFTDSTQIVDMFTMRTVNRMDDYFTSSKLSPLVSDINNSTFPLGDYNLGLGNQAFVIDPLVLDSNLNNSSNTGPNNLMNYGNTDDGGGNTSRAVNQLRALFAQEKLLHVMNMTHKDYDSMVLARLGYDVPKDVKHGVQHLGHDVCQLNIQEIVSGSNTFTGETGSALGDLAGQGKAISRDFKGFNFTAPCHGVLMSIWTCRTRPKYTVSALRKDMLVDITDFFTPELDDLGMQPQYKYETALVNRLQQGYPAVDKSINPFIITGWNYRYEYLKRNINRSSLAFMRADDGIFTPEGGDWHPGYNSYSQWSYSRVPLDPAIKVNGLSFDPEDDYYSRPHVDLYKVQPTELNNIMLTQWLAIPPTSTEDPSQFAEDWYKYPWLMYQRDPFIVDGRFDCKKVSAMSIYSMPKLV